MNAVRMSVWSQRWKLWLPALLFFVLNLGAFLLYRVVFAGEAVVSQASLDRAQERLASLEVEHRELEDLLARIEGTRERIAELYATAFATEAERMTETMREVRRLAGDARLEPSITSYPQEPINEYGLVKRSFVFSVEGTYFDLRSFINNLEISDHFLTLESVGLSEGGGRGSGAELRIDLRISTLFGAGDRTAAAVGEGAT